MDRTHDIEDTLEALRADAEIAHVLLGFSARLAEVGPWDSTLQSSVNVVREVLGADWGIAATWDRAGERLILHATSGFSDVELAVLKRYAESPSALSLARAALEERRPLLVEDVPADGRVPAEEIRDRKLGAKIAIPLIHRGEELGVLAVEYRSPRRFGSKEEALAHGIGRQLTVALANARQFTLLQGLRNFGLSLGARFRLSEVTNEIARGAAALLAGSGGGLYLFDASRRALMAAATHGVSAGGAERYARIDVSVEPWSGLLEGRPVLVSRSGVRLDPARPEDVSIVAASIMGPVGSLLGAVLVFFDRSVNLGADEAEALSVLAAQSSMAIENAQRFERQRSMARSLQAGLLSTEMPNFDAGGVAAIYEPASTESDIGGDFYDLFEVGDGLFGVVVGDVSGKGAEAAAQTAQAKYVLRAFASRNRSPASVLFHLNNALCQSLAEDRFATLMFAVYDAVTLECQVAVGGHPPPLVYRRATNKVEVVGVAGGLLGAFENQQFDQVGLSLHPGDSLIAYTDGLVEARSGTELYGVERLIDAVRRYAPVASADALARSLANDAKRFGEITDDMVVFVLESTGGQAPDALSV